MTTEDRISQKDYAVARAVISALDEHLISVKPLASGSTSDVFYLRSNRSEYVLKIANPHPGKRAIYSADAVVRKLLNKSGLPVACPIATDHTMCIDISAQWALDLYCEGRQLERGMIPAVISNQLGQLLFMLHKLPATGFGRLEDTRSAIRGKCSNPINGLLSRFESPWPFSSKSLGCHPSVRDDAGLLKKITSIEAALGNFPEGGEGVVVHSDLHEAQLLVSNNKLNALLDFNETMIGRREWDFGSYYYFHGRACLADLLEGYTDNISVRENYMDESLSAAVLIALHHGNRGEILGKPHRIKASVRFLNEQLV